MSDDTLTAAERAALLLLLAEATEADSTMVGNNELAERFGNSVTIVGKVKNSLNSRKLIETRKIKGHGNQQFHALTESGWGQARQELTGDLPTGLWGRAVALALTAQLDRYLDRNNLGLYDIFVAEAPAPPSDEESVDEDPADEPSDLDLGTRVRAAYRTLAPRANAWVKLVDLRAALGDVARDDLDAELHRLIRVPGVTLIPESNQKTLTDADRAAAIRIGNQSKHLIAIEAE
ncbi:hypothetical protein [Cryptosporangium aurantiacum]|uniref:Uncharacterized protein n=1 Tax=Cryptosporangium aurantiacum TaxID=134849 RepID=A0A1M7GVS0_9ACTN|nr:hypothetical protein [Cryptosporangium aurantiacum]SHM20544.1 hypothetical protein SAMN05443668_1013 [Cryptosporangium aurantiacum]